MSFCSRCGTEAAPGVKFCPKCGNALEATNVGATPNPVQAAPVTIPNPLAKVDVKDPTIMLSLISVFGAFFALIGGFINAIDKYENFGGLCFLYILTLLAFIAPTVLVTLYFLNIGGLGKNRMMLTINFASLAAYPLFYFITLIAVDSKFSSPYSDVTIFTFHTFLFSFGIIAAVAIALYCGMGGFAKKTMFTIAMAAGIALEGEALRYMVSAIQVEEYFFMFAVICAFVARIAVYIALLLFVTGKKENA